MTVQELVDKLNLTLEDDVIFRVNGFDRDIQDLPMQGFNMLCTVDIDTILIHLKSDNNCEIVLHLGHLTSKPYPTPESKKPDGGESKIII